MPLTGEARKVLAEEGRHCRTLEARLGVSLEYVFVDDEGRDFNPEPRRNRVSQRTKVAMKQIGRPECNFHSLRHTTASWLVQAGVDLARVREFMRHKSIQTTLRYAHLHPEHLDTVVSALDSAMSRMDTQVDTSLQPVPTASAKLLKTNTRL